MIARVDQLRENRQLRYAHTTSDRLRLPATVTTVRDDPLIFNRMRVRPPLACSLTSSLVLCGALRAATLQKKNHQVCSR